MVPYRGRLALRIARLTMSVLCTGWFLGSGERLFDGFEAGKPALELDRVLEAPGVVHLRYRVIR